MTVRAHNCAKTVATCALALVVGAGSVYAFGDGTTADQVDQPAIVEAAAVDEDAPVDEGPTDAAIEGEGADADEPSQEDDPSAEGVQAEGAASQGYDAADEPDIAAGDEQPAIEPPAAEPAEDEPAAEQPAPVASADADPSTSIQAPADGQEAVSPADEEQAPSTEGVAVIENAADAADEAQQQAPTAEGEQPPASADAQQSDAAATQQDQPASDQPASDQPAANAGDAATQQDQPASDQPAIDAAAVAPAGAVTYAQGTIDADVRVTPDDANDRDVITYDVSAREVADYEGDLSAVLATGAFAPQGSGTFYSLLPAGQQVDTQTVRAYLTTGVEIPSWSMSVNAYENWRDSGRTMLVVDVWAPGMADIAHGAATVEIADNYTADEYTARSSLALTFNAYRARPAQPAQPVAAGADAQVPEAPAGTAPQAVDPASDQAALSADGPAIAEDPMVTEHPAAVDPAQPAPSPSAYEEVAETVSELASFVFVSGNMTIAGGIEDNAWYAPVSDTEMPYLNDLVPDTNADGTPNPWGTSARELYTQREMSFTQTALVEVAAPAVDAETTVDPDALADDAQPTADPDLGAADPDPVAADADPALADESTADDDAPVNEADTEDVDGAPAGTILDRNGALTVEADGGQTVTYTVHAAESIDYGGGLDAILEDGSFAAQSTGTFYNLLPAGQEPAVETVRAYTTSGAELSAESLAVTTAQNWRDSGRTMLIVDVQADSANFESDEATADSAITLAFDAVQTAADQPVADPDAIDPGVQQEPGESFDAAAETPSTNGEESIDTADDPAEETPETTPAIASFAYVTGNAAISGGRPDTSWDAPIAASEMPLLDNLVADTNDDGTPNPWGTAARVLYAEGGAMVDQISSTNAVTLTSASVPLTANAANTVEVGKSITIDGPSGGKKYEWTIRDGNSYVQINNEDKQTVTVIGLAEGTATLQCAEYKKDKDASPHSTKDYTVIVTGGEASKELNADGTGYSVSVKGNTHALPDGVTLHVDEVSRGGDYDVTEQLTSDLGISDAADLSFLKMYHIYLKQNGEDYQPDGSTNLKVTITYDETPKGWPTDGKLSVGHYKKNGASYELADLAGAESDPVSAKIKSVSVSGKSATFHIKDFSVVAIGKLSSPDGSRDVTEDEVPLHYQWGALGLSDLGHSGNEWEIGTAGYWQSINGTRMIKTIVPTGIEDVFQVSIYIERDPANTDFSEVLKNMGAWFVNQNDGHVQDKKMGAIVDAVGYHNGDTGLTADENKGTSTTNYLNIKYVDKNGKELASYKAYPTYSTYNTGSYKAVVAPLPNGKWLLVSDGKSSIKWGDTVKCSLTDEQINSIKDAIAPKVGVLGIKDTLDVDRFEFLGSAMNNTGETTGKQPKATLGTVKYDSGNGIAKWTDLEDLTLDSGLATMSYYVRLKTSEQNGALSDITPVQFGTGGPIVGTGSAYPVSTTIANFDITWRNLGAIGNSDDIAQQIKEITKTVTIDEPSAKGLLYYIKLKKVDATDTNIALEGATFKVNGKDGFGNTINTTITTGSDGTGINGTGLPWGNYSIEEITPPIGYKISKNDQRDCELHYLGKNSGSTVESIDSKAGKKLESSPFKNDPASIILKIKKVDPSGKLLEGAEFTISKTGNDAGLINESITTGDKGLVLDTKVLLSGNYNISYTIEETKAPDNYVLPDGEGRKMTVAITREDKGPVIKVNGEPKHLGETDENGDYPLELEMINTPASINLLVIKHDSNNRPLSGAKFTLSGGNMATPITKEVLESNSITIDGYDGKQFVATFPGISPGNGYKISETFYPAGYAEDDPSYKTGYTIDVKDGKAYHKNNQLESCKDQDGVTYYYLIVKNKPLDPLPTAGGPGAALPISIGTTMMLGASTWMLSRRRRSATMRGRAVARR